VFGGGRYDKLLQNMGGRGEEPLPAVGFGFGDAVIIELLKVRGLLPLLDKPDKDSVQVMVYSMDSALLGKAIALGSELRGKGINVDMVLDERKPKWVFQRADKMGVKYVVMLASQEDERGLVILKDLSTGQQKEIPPDLVESSLSFPAL
jgi:histidyl-tRNA synthetase